MYKEEEEYNLAIDDFIKQYRLNHPVRYWYDKIKYSINMFLNKIMGQKIPF